MTPLPLHRRFLLVLLPVVVAGPILVGLAARWSAEQDRQKVEEQHIAMELRRASLPVLDRLHRLSTSLEEFASHSPRADGAFDAFVDSTRRLLDDWPEIEEAFLSHPVPSGLQVWRVRRAWARELVLPPNTGPDGFFAQTPAEPALRWDGSGRQTRAWWGWDDPRESLALRVGVIVDPHSIALETPPRFGSAPCWFALVAPSGEVVSAVNSVDASPTERAATQGLRGRRWSVDSAEADVADRGWMAAGEPELPWGLGLVLAVPREAMAGFDWHESLLMLLVTALVALVGVLIIGHQVNRVSQPLDRLGGAMQRVASGDLGPRLEIRGSDEMVQLSRAFNSMVIDLQTTHEAMEFQRQALSRALREAEGVERMKDDFLALVSHEVRTPLTTILGGIEFLLEGFQEHHDATEVEFMTMVQDSAHRLGSFMNDAILMANLQSRGGEQAFEEFSLQALVEMQIEKIRGPVAEREIRLENPLARCDEVFVQGDWTLFQVAVEKLLDNAWRHNHGSGLLHVDLVDRIEEAAEDGGGSEADLAALMASRERFLPDPDHEWRALRVMNTGPCLEPEQIPGLFRRFELAHEIEHHQRGSGLSLPIVHSIVEYHGGCVQARRIVDRGMAFYVVLCCRNTGRPRRAMAPMPEGIDDVVRMARQLSRDGQDPILSCGPGPG